MSVKEGAMALVLFIYVIFLNIPRARITQVLTYENAANIQNRIKKASIL